MKNSVNIVPAERKDLPVITQLAPEIWQYAYKDILSAGQMEALMFMID